MEEKIIFPCKVCRPFQALLRNRINRMGTQSEVDSIAESFTFGEELFIEGLLLGRFSFIEEINENRTNSGSNPHFLHCAGGSSPKPIHIVEKCGPGLDHF